MLFVADRAQPRSRSQIAPVRVFQFATAPNRRARRIPRRHPQAANPARPLRDNATARFEKTKVDRAALHRWRPVAPPPAISRRKFPAPSQLRPASESKSDKAGADLVSLLRPRGILSGGNVTRLA